jgi:hypothetical protein
MISELDSLGCLPPAMKRIDCASRAVDSAA